MHIIVIDEINIYIILCHTAWPQNKYGERAGQTFWRLFQIKPPFYSMETSAPFLNFKFFELVLKFRHFEWAPVLN